MAALTEMYCSVAGAGAHDGTSAGAAWTFAEAIAGAAAGQLVNIISGSYSTAAVTFTAGTATNAVVFRGYASSIGDLDIPTFATNGSLVTTGFPVITASASLIPSPFCTLQNLVITSGLSADTMLTTTNDNNTLINCRVVNTANNSAARAMRLDNTNTLICCEFECTGAAHASVLDFDSTSYLFGCRIKGVSASFLVTGEAAIFEKCTFVGNAANSGLQIQVMSDTSLCVVSHCTFQNLVKAIEMIDAAIAQKLVLISNHVTDCGTYLSNLRSATSDLCTYEIRNRTRNNTTPRGSGIQIAGLAGEVTTAGTIAEDYTDVSTYNYYLVAAAPGRNVGVMPYTDIGALQRVEPTGGAGTVIHYTFQ